MKRRVTPELLDTDSGTSQEIADSLQDLRQINRRFGGVATTQALLEHVAKERGLKSLSLLEVAAGASEVPALVRPRLLKQGVQIEVTLLDRRASHFGDGSTNGTRVVAGDALALPFSDSSFDVVCSNLFVHHMAPQEVIRLVNESLRVARVAVLINDLIRHPIHLALVHAGRPLYRSRVTRHDAPASVWQAYTKKEMLDLIKKTNATRVEMTQHFLFRMGVVIWR
ncbi:MAG TPA: methyltransferase domain-containing protein [Terriglobales bacterium]|nr:methyltransferase domain-containing protein [Terriglobales bacterium]